MAPTPGGERPRREVHLQRAEDAAVDGDWVIAPGGRRLRSHVHLVQPGQVLVLREPAPGLLRRRPHPGPPPVANWIVYAGWLNTTGKPVSSLLTTWTVPPPPTLVANQLIYLFNGIEPGDASTIVQPVLQWGDSGTDEDGVNRTGPFWTAASWIVPAPDGQTYHTPHVRVQPGDRLVGSVVLTNSGAEGFTYNCQFEGLAGTLLPTPPVPELLWCVETLEAYELVGQHQVPYDLDKASEYPGTASIAFQNIAIVTDAPGPAGAWVKENIVTAFGEHAEVTADSTTNGTVTIFLQR